MVAQPEHKTVSHLSQPDISSNMALLKPRRNAGKTVNGERKRRKRKSNIWLAIKFNFYVGFHWKETQFIRPIIIAAESKQQEAKLKVSSFSSSLHFRVNDAPLAAYHNESCCEEKGFTWKAIKRTLNQNVENINSHLYQARKVIMNT